MFPMSAWIAIQGLPLQHWNRTYISKLLINFAYVIDIRESTLDKLDMRAAKVYVGCDNLASLPRSFNAVLGSQLCKIEMDVN